MAAFPEYLWIAVVGSILGFVYAFGIGANDVANAFASTVSSKSLTLKQAIIAAGIFEFSGAILLGAAVTSTIRSKIFDLTIYEGEEDIVLLGMFTSLITATIMLFIATAIGLPVSTTQTIVGTIMGFSIVAKGFSSINRTVTIQIFLSWLLSPSISGIVAFLFFGFIKVFIHNSGNPYQRAYYFFPVILTIFIGIDLFFVIYKGVSNNWSDKLNLAWVLPAAFGAGLLCGVVWLVLIGPIARRRIEAKFAAIEANQADADADVEDAKGFKSELPNAPSVDGDDDDVEKTKTPEEAATTMEENKTTSETTAPEEQAPPVEEPKSFMARMSKSFAENTYGQDLAKQSFHENKASEQIWGAAEGFDPKAEEMFTYVQVFTACLNSFSHGANDVANSIGPMSAIITIYQTGVINSNTGVQKWILAYGGVGIVLGLLCYGYKVMKSIGYKLTALSPSRGSCAELAASLYVVTASYMKIPVSSTQCIVGAVTGVGLVGGLKNVGWCFFLKICIGWILEFFTAVCLSAGIFAMFAFSPSLMYD